MDIDLRGYFRIVYRQWWVLAAGLAVGLVLGYLVFHLLGALPSYHATTTILVTDTSSTARADPYGTLVLTYAELARQDTVTQAVVEALGLPISAQEVAEATEVRVIADTRLMEISVTHRDPQVAAAVANEVARQLANQPTLRTYRLQVVSAAKAPSRPSLGPYVNVLLAGALGLFLAAGLVFVREYLVDTVRETQTAAARLGLPVLGTIVNDTDAPAQAIWPLVERCTRLGREAGYRRLLITSPGPGEGKSTTALLLATAWTRTGRTAILVDAHVQHPVLHERLGCANDTGLTDWLLSPGEPLPTCPLPDGLALLPRGPAPADPVVVLASQEWPAMLAALDRQADIVIIDGPPILPAAEVALLAPLVDGVLLVLRADETKYAAAGEALEALRLVAGPVMGLVLTKG